MVNPMDLTGKHILVTGASSGIGRATCILVSQLGAKVSLVARNEERLAETISQMEGDGHKTYAFDLTDLEGIEALVKRITAEQGLIDGLAHCAGICENRPIKLAKPAYVSEVMLTNFSTFAELLRVLSSKRFVNECASMVGISSVAAFGGEKAQGIYAASKAAINGLIHPVAKELAQRNIRVNSIAFGMVETNMFEEYKQVGGDANKLLARQYLGFGKPNDAANIIAFLLGNASAFITGTTLVADGGVLS